ncbi:MAG TPA: hypothetical protein PJ984_02130 [Candidatus Saccharibacteria bacterium]|jgi:hypothetical protein|nr:hypothetical protein [Candidatus Saccharibacteria bacterium]
MPPVITPEEIFDQDLLKDDNNDDTGSRDFVVGNQGFKPWKVVMAFVAMLIITTGVILGVIQYKNDQADVKLRKERIDNAQRDLNNRVATEGLNGKFTAVFFVGAQMRTRWVSNDGKKRCVMNVAPPTDDVLRYSTLDVPDDTAGFKQLNDPNAIGCLTSGGAGGIGGV